MFQVAAATYAAPVLSVVGTGSTFVRSGNRDDFYPDAAAFTDNCAVGGLSRSVNGKKYRNFFGRISKEECDGIGIPAGMALFLEYGGDVNDVFVTVGNQGNDAHARSTMTAGCARRFCRIKCLVRPFHVASHVVYSAP